MAAALAGRRGRRLEGLARRQHQHPSDHSGIGGGLSEIHGPPFRPGPEQRHLRPLSAFFALDLQPGDEVLVPTATWWASALPMLWAGLLPVFCECEQERLGIDPADMEAKITERTRAVVVVHLWGMPAKMTEIFAIAKKHNLKSSRTPRTPTAPPGACRPCGTLGDISVFSLQGDKLAPAGEGGVFLTDNEQYFERAICLGDVVRIFQLETPARRFAATTFGIKTRIAPLSAAIARVQLKLLAQHNRQRNENIVYLSKKMEVLGLL